jgi:hypothetical protein
MEPPRKRVKTSSSGNRCSTRTLKTEAVERVILAMTEIGQPPDIAQMQAMNSHWLNLMDIERVVASIVTQMTFMGAAPTPEQIGAIRKGVTRLGTPIAGSPA